MTGGSVRVVVIDDDMLLRSGLRLILDGDPAITVVGEAGTGKGGVALIRKEHPDVALVDIRMPDGDGVEVVREVRAHPQTANVAVVMLTALDTDTAVMDSLDAGASGFLLKTVAPVELVASIHAAAAGQQILSPAVLRTLVGLARTGHPVHSDDREWAGLSMREREVAQLIACGLTNQEIARKLTISLPTVKTHVASVMKKLGVDNRVRIAVAALENQ